MIELALVMVVLGAWLTSLQDHITKGNAGMILVILLLFPIGCVHGAQLWHKSWQSRA